MRVCLVLRGGHHTDRERRVKRRTGRREMKAEDVGNNKDERGGRVTGWGRQRVGESETPPRPACVSRGSPPGGWLAGSRRHGYILTLASISLSCQKQLYFTPVLGHSRDSLSRDRFSSPRGQDVSSSLPSATTYTQPMGFYQNSSRVRRLRNKNTTLYEFYQELKVYILFNAM